MPPRTPSQTYNPTPDKVSRVLRGFLQGANVLPMDSATTVASVLAGEAVSQRTSNDGPDVIVGRELWAMLHQLCAEGGFTRSDGTKVQVNAALLSAALPSSGGWTGLGTGGVLGSGIGILPGDENAYDLGDALEVFGVDLDSFL
jgi:hypothetical protein